MQYFLIKKVLNKISKVFISNNYLILLMFVAQSFIFGFYMYEFEDLTLVDTIYYLITTATTVGYGDISPQQPIGRILSTIYMIFSIGTLSVIIGAIIEKFVNLIDLKKKGKGKMKKEPKLVIVGYPNEDKIKKIISEMRSEMEEKIVIVTDSLEEKPEWFNKLDIVFIKGHISSEDTLSRANIKEADIILVLTEDNSELADDSTMAASLLINNIKKSSSRMIVEFNTIKPLYEGLFKHSTLTTTTSAHVLAQEILDEGAIDLSNAIFKNEIAGTQYNIEYKGEITTWKEIAFKLIERSCIPEAYKCSLTNNFNFTPDPEAIIEKGCLIKYRGKVRLVNID